MRFDLRFRAMGTSAHLLLEGSGGLLSSACAEIARLEQLWSRFIPESELSRLNRAEGTPIKVSRETVELVERSREGWKMTDGLFDPAILHDLVAAGYDRDFDEVRVQAGPVPRSDRTGRLNDAIASIEIDRRSGEVTFPSGVEVDSGGIGKGLGADLVAERLVGDGADAVLVNLGGDMRSAGTAPTEGWSVALDNPFEPSGVAIAQLRLDQAALATTTSLVRRWQQDGKDRHHLIDPRTGEPAESDVASVTVIAERGWLAEVLAKGCFIGGVEQALTLLPKENATGLIVDVEGRIHCAPGLDAYLAEPLASKRVSKEPERPKVTVRIPAGF